MRLLALLALGYLLFRAVKTLLSGRSGGALRGGANPQAGGSQIDDVMVKDPHCGIYFARREGIPLTHDGQTLYFCCDQCRDEFVRESSGGRPSD